MALQMARDPHNPGHLPVELYHLDNSALYSFDHFLMLPSILSTIQ